MDNATDEFNALQAMADADHEATSVRTQNDLTADIQIIFKRDKEYKHPDTGKIQDGHWCKKFLGDPHVEKKACFLTGSISMLHMHVAHCENHVKVYLEHCNALGILTNPRALL
ncbi:hypothetical protein L208DRAFT_1377266 [Tricholoma matsutake]|nr:hypothetical protein L208DRAFT_1377266 [Tricholoma matsutake 945]